MSNQSNISFQKILIYYVLLFIISILVSLVAYEDINFFVKSKIIESVLIGCACVGFLYVVSISKIKDILLIKMFNTEKYDEIYRQANTLKQGQSKLFKESIYMDKYGPLNHLVDMVRSCGWTMILSYPLMVLLLHFEASWYINIVCLLVISISILSLLISSYFLYRNLKILYNFNK